MINFEIAEVKPTLIWPAEVLDSRRHPAIRLGGSAVETAGFVGEIAHIDLAEVVYVKDARSNGFSSEWR